MAIQPTDQTAQSQNQNTQTTSTNAAPGGGGGAPAPHPEHAMTLRDLANIVPVASGLSPEGKCYVDRLNSLIDGMKTNNTPGAKDIKLTHLTSPAGVIMAEVGSRVCPILMQETVGSTIPQNMPVTIALKEVMESYRKFYRNDEFDIVSPIVITPADYGKVDTMATWLVGVLNDYFQENPISAAIMGNDPIMLSVNSAECKEFVQRNSPHGVMARHDLAFKLSVIPKGSNYQNKNDLFGNYRSDATDVAVVTAYTEILIAPPDGTGIGKFTPVIHITDVVSRIQDPKMFIMLVAIATELFQRIGFWKNQFAVFDKNKPNLGNLIQDPTTNDLRFISNPQELEAFVRTYMTAPVMVIDIADGRARIPGTELFILGTKEANAKLRQVFEGIFSKTNVQLPMTAPSEIVGYENIGMASMGGQLADTRWVDYLSLAIHHKADLATIGQFLNRMQAEVPSARFDRVRTFYPDARALYSNNLVRISLPFIAAVQNEMREYVQLAPGSAGPGQQPVDFSGAIQETMQFLGQMHSFQVGSGAQFNNYTTIAPGLYRQY